MMVKNAWIGILLLGSQLAQAQSIFDSLARPQIFFFYFDSGDDQLDEEAEETLTAAVAALSGAESKVARITARTDDVGSSTYNQALAERRARSLVQALEERGVSTKNIIVTALGEKDPLSSNALEIGRQKNRSASIEVATLIPMVDFAGRITDQNTGQGIAATILFASKTRADSIKTDTSGRYSVQLPKDSVVQITVKAPNYFFESKMAKMFGSKALFEKYKISPDITLQPALPGEKMVLRDLFFVGGQAILLPISQLELPKILEFMQMNPDLMVEIAGHINRPFDENDPRLKHLKTTEEKAAAVMNALSSPSDLTLSERRARVVYDYLRSKQISPERLTYKGYNNSQMLFPHATSESEQQQNRRVEIRVTGKLPLQTPSGH